jgi:glycosyltransferase involved in cell wall biosynthesis
MPTPRPLSVIVPVRDGSATLARALTAILASELPRDDYELIVVDDASSDSSAELAARYADTVVRLTMRKSGAAYARNRGAELARGEVLAFVDADAMVRPDTLPRMLQMLSDQPGLDAVSASHEQTAGAPNLVSQYWNLLLHFGEQMQAGTTGNVASPSDARFFFRRGCTTNGVSRPRASKESSLRTVWRIRAATCSRALNSRSPG